MLTSEQIEMRARGLGGSDAPIVCGESARMTALDLFHVKRGEIAAPGVFQHEAWVGSHAEPVIDAWYQQAAQVKTRQVHKTRLHKELPWMLGHPDRLLVGEKRGVEYKLRARSTDWGPDGTDYVPSDVRLQCQHYMEVMGYELWDVCVWLPPFDFRLYTIERDRGIADALIDIESAFWQRIQDNDPPPADYEHATTGGLLERMYPGTTGQTMDLPESCTHWHAVYQDARDQRLNYEKVEAGARNHLLHVMEHRAVGYLHDGNGAAYIRETRPDGTLKRFYFKQGARRGN